MQTDKSVERPLHSLRVIEFEGIGPGPLAGRMLSDLGAHVILVARPTISPVDRALIGENAENPLRQGKEIAVGGAPSGISGRAPAIGLDFGAQGRSACQCPNLCSPAPTR